MRCSVLAAGNRVLPVRGHACQQCLAVLAQHGDDRSPAQRETLAGGPVEEGGDVGPFAASGSGRGSSPVATR